MIVGWHGYVRYPRLSDPDLQRARDAVEEEQWAQAHPALVRLGITSRTGLDEALERLARNKSDG